MIPIIWLNNEQKSWSTCLEPSFLLGAQSITIGKGPLSYFFFGWRPFLNDRTKLKIMRCQSFYVCSFDKVIGKTLWKLHLFYPLGLYLPTKYILLKLLKLTLVVHSAIKLAKKNCNLGSHESMALKFNSGTTMFEKKAKKVDFHLWAIIVLMYVTLFFQ